ncbi:MAG: hypothetical protein AB7U75_16550 [Hyphomicrobiaceae bacterium]
MTSSNPLPGMGSASSDRTAAARALKDLVRKEFGITPDAAVFVAEIACGEIDCPDAETVIALYLDEKRAEFRLSKPIAEITGADIATIASRHAGDRS